MSLTPIDDQAWTGPITLTMREIIQVWEGQLVYVAFGATAPTGAQDGAKLREESQMICESGQVLWFRAAVGRASIYRGEFK